MFIGYLVFLCIGVMVTKSSPSLCRNWCEYPKGSGLHSCCENVPINGGWSVWSTWSTCSSDCQQSRTRSCIKPKPKNGGLDCPGNLTSTQSCTGEDCIEPCNDYCEHPIGSNQYRCCDDVTPAPPPLCRNWCQYPSGSGQHMCCENVPINGGWSVWSSWSTCSSDCQQSRTRSCIKPKPKNGGLDCPGNLTSSQSCTGEDCIEPCNDYCEHPIGSNQYRCCDDVTRPITTPTPAPLPLCRNWCQYPIGSGQHMCCENVPQILWWSG